MKILIATEKHGTGYYDASTPEVLAKSALKLLTRRFEQGWYYDPAEEPESRWGRERRELREMPQEALDALPQSVRADVEKKRAVAIRDKQYDDGVTDWYRRAKQVVDEQDARLVSVGRGKYERKEPVAWLLLKERDGGEYEHVEIETVISADED